MQYFASQRINLRKVKVQKEDGITAEDGIKVNVKIAKNRIARDNPYKATSYTALYGYGIDDVREVAQLSQDAGVIDKRGSWYYYPNKENIMEWDGTKLAFNGQANYIDFLRSTPDFKAHIKDLLNGKAQVGILSDEEIAAIEAEEKALEAEISSVLEEAPTE